MKTKNKTLAVVEIAIVLCSMLLVALPAIAAATEKTYKHTDLDVFGNANEDDTIDMRDTTYIKLVIFGKKPKTDLADANYDGKVSMLDVGQTKLIILGKEKKLTFIDILGEAETVNKPIKRLANLGSSGLQVARMLNAMDILLPVVGYDRSSQPTFYPEFSKWPAVGYEPDSCDFEYVLSLKPDVMQTNIEAAWTIPKGSEYKRLFKEKLPGIPIICLNMREPDVFSQNMRTYGYILDRKKEAEELIDWFLEDYNTIKSRTDGLSEDARPRVYLERLGRYKSKSYKDRCGQTLILAGGKNIVDEIQDVPTSPQVDPEFVVEQNPEFIFLIISGGYVPVTLYGYETDDPSKFIEMRQEILDRPELANVDAVKNKRVYVIAGNLIGGAGNLAIGAGYMGKVMHPDLFEDKDPQAMHQEYVDKFCHIDFDVRKHGVFFYPPLE